MLSPTVRTAAAQFANTQLGKPAMQAIALGYETGYCAGVRAPRAATFPLSGQREFLRVLGPYVAENITVYHPATGRYGLLRGLPGTYEGQGEPLADVEFYADAEAREEGGGDVMEPYGRILPVLYGFEDLAVEMVLTDGRVVVPAVEVAKVLVDQYIDHPSDAAYHGVKYYAGFIEVYYNGALILIKPDGTAFYDDEPKEPANVATQLRQWHFAVGLAPDQYHRRVVGFDYASGTRPESFCGGCGGKVCRAGCEAGKEPSHA